MALLHIFFLIISSLRFLLDVFLYLCFNNILLIKICLISFFSYAVYRYILKKKYILSKIRQQKYQNHMNHKIHDENDLDISISIIFLYIMFFIVGIFLLRIQNMTRFLDLNQYHNKIQHIISLLPLFDIIINIIIILYIIILYIIILSQLFKYIKFHFFRIYYYIFLKIYNNNPLVMLNYQSYLRLNYYTRDFRLFFLEQKLKNFPSFKYALSIHIDSLQFLIHRIIMLIVMLYDLISNNLILSHVFKILPIIFIYELWCKISITLTGLNLEYDKVISLLLYGKITQIDCDKEYLYLNDLPYETTVIKDIIVSYARYGFVDKFFLPKNPINEGIEQLVIYWKNFIIKNIIKKYPLIDILSIIILCIYSFILCF